MGLYEVQWGDVPTWVGASATVLTLAVAIAAALYARGAYETSRRTYQLEVHRERDAKLQQELWQASAIDLWEDQEQGSSLRRTYGVTVSNANATPIRDVTVRWFSHDGSELRGELSRSLLPPGETFIARYKEMRHSESGDAAEDLAVFVEPTNGMPVTLRFRDSAGVYWVREQDGRLRRDS